VAGFFSEIIFKMLKQQQKNIETKTPKPAKIHSKNKREIFSQTKTEFFAGKMNSEILQVEGI
jgi:hypothetical protein